MDLLQSFANLDIDVGKQHAKGGKDTVSQVSIPQVLFYALRYIYSLYNDHFFFVRYFIGWLFAAASIGRGM